MQALEEITPYNTSIPTISGNTLIKTQPQLYLQIIKAIIIEYIESKKLFEELYIYVNIKDNCNRTCKCNDKILSKLPLTRNARRSVSAAAKIFKNNLTSVLFGIVCNCKHFNSSAFHHSNLKNFKLFYININESCTYTNSQLTNFNVLYIPAKEPSFYF